MTDPKDEATVAHLLRSESPPSARSACPDDNLLVGWAEGRLDAPRRAHVEAHLSGCDTCRRMTTDLAEGLADDLPTAARGDGPAPVLSLPAARRRAGPLALAAAILLALGAGLAALWSRSQRGAGDDLDATLVAAAEKLRSSSPDAFAAFVPAGRAERLASPADATRAALSVLRPAALLLDDRPRVEWSDATGAEAYDVVLAGPDGTEVWKRRTTTSSLEFPEGVPALAPGTSYVVEISAVGAAGGGRATRGFRVASAAERAAWEKAVAEAGRLLDAPVRDLLLAHAAARRGLLLEAHARIDAHLAARTEPVGEETRAWIRRLLSWSAERPSRGGAGN